MPYEMAFRWSMRCVEPSLPLNADGSQSCRKRETRIHKTRKEDEVSTQLVDYAKGYPAGSKRQAESIAKLHEDETGHRTIVESALPVRPR